MATSITVANINIPNVDANGAFIDASVLGKTLAPLTNDLKYHLTQSDAYDSTGAHIMQSSIITVFLLTTNDTTALNAYTSFVSTLASGTITQVWYSTQTLGA